MDLHVSRVMTIFAHPDDETFCAGGTLASLSEHDIETYAVYLVDEVNRRVEFKEACTDLGIVQGYNLGLDLHNDGQIANRKRLESILLEVRPEVVITHMSGDYHLEHLQTRQLVLEAVEWASHTSSHGEAAHMVSKIYEAETTILFSNPSHLFDVTSYYPRKRSAIRRYTSQLDKGGTNFYLRFSEKKAELRGLQANCKYAEAFQLIPHRINHPFSPVPSSML